MAPAKKTRLGWLGPVIVLVGLAVGGLGIWYMVHARPRAGDTIDTIAIDDRSKFVIRDEAGGDGDRSFVELWIGDELKWQALVPKYAGAKGRPAISWSQGAVIVRVIRNNRAEVFALSMDNASKLGGFRLAPDHEQIDLTATGPLSASDHIRSYEVVSGPDWHELIGVDLQRGKGLWRTELGPAPVTSLSVTGGEVTVFQGARKRRFLVFNGAEKPPSAP